MNGLPMLYGSGVEQMLGTASLEEMRNKALLNIQANGELSRRQKNSIIKELDFLIEHERLQRLRKFAYQWIEEREAFRNSILQKRNELINSIRLSRKQTDLQVAQINREILNYKLDAIDRIRRMRPRNESTMFYRKAALELKKLRLQNYIITAREEMLHRNLAVRTLKRQEFFARVRKQYPDMADELMEYYDQQVFQQTKRR